MKSVIITGSNGGIGSAICSHFLKLRYKVIGIDLGEDRNHLDSYLSCDLSKLKISTICDSFTASLQSEIGDSHLVGLVNNAALQVCGGIESISVEDFSRSLDVNVVAPFILSKICFSNLKENSGSIVNIGSIHSKLTKPNFVAYATSKSALLGLTQSLAVDCGASIRVNAIQPAAIATEMLLDGFKDNPDSYSKLRDYHPTKSIGETSEIARVVEFLLLQSNKFLNGSVIDVSGGISCRLHDPV
ncbi:SDR family NAD(P)-dependent oxidoreductase [Gallaecimonas xiamenensis]|uniref:Oxidoreductase n=1 Tax=Gallaecimonas xiamenensis 3-C-1 TaxID=745411 RepID=K2JLS1_9GAMM|nr:SDR family oxidoreductase [Gallaecimonas xiamenensis]EKE75367.1 oxidoreductase [Gallaecimonas xiamenensis 3-C-1]